MEEVDEVGEVDMGFDLASWMNEDVNDDEEKNGSFSATRALKAGGGSHTQNSTTQQPRAPLTPTMRKVLAVAEEDKMSTIGSKKSEMLATTPEIAVKSQDSPCSKTSNLASTTPANSIETQGKTNALKTGQAKEKIGHMSESTMLRSKPVAIKPADKAENKLVSTSDKKIHAQKNLVAKVTKPVATPNVVKPPNEVKKLQAQPVARAQTRSSTVNTSKAIAVQKKVVTGTKTATMPDACNGVISSPPVTTLKSSNIQIKKNPPLISASTIKNPQAAAQSSPQPKTPAQLKALKATNLPLTAKIKSTQQMKAGVDVTKLKPDVKPVEISSSVQSIKLNASKSEDINDVSVSLIPNLVKSTKTPEFSSSDETSHATLMLTKAPLAKKAPLISTTVSKPSCVASTLSSTSQNTPQAKGMPSNTVDTKSNTPSSNVSLVIKSESSKVLSAGLEKTVASTIPTQIIKTSLSTTAVTSDTVQTVPVTQISPLPTPPSSSSISGLPMIVEGSESTVATKSKSAIQSTAKNTSVRVASATTLSKSSPSVNSVQDKFESSMKKDNKTTMSYIAGDMAQVFTQDAFEDMDLGFTMSMEDDLDLPLKPCNKDAVFSKKRSFASAGDGPPCKQTKSEAVAVKSPSPLKGKDNIVKMCHIDSKQNQSSTPSGKVFTPKVEKKRIKKSQQERQIKKNEEEIQIKIKEEGKQMKIKEEEKQNNLKGLEKQMKVKEQEQMKIKDEQKQIKIKGDQKLIEENKLEMQNKRKQEVTKIDDQQIKKLQEANQIPKDLEKHLTKKIQEENQINPISKITQSSAINDSKVLSRPTKRIVRRFHRGSQTLISEKRSKLLQCLIRIPSLDNPAKSTASVTVSANIDLESEDREPYYMSPLPSTVQQNVLKSVLLFNINQLATRHIKPEAFFTHGISIGHVTQAEMDKSLFRENIVSKSSYYNFQFNGQDGVMDLYFTNEDAFTAVLTQIRKTKIGPRYLPVTFFKVLSKTEQDKESPQPFVRVTVVFDQNFASSAFLGYVKAQVWNKPKVEETFSVHNMPGGIPLEFLKQILPDAITMDVEDEALKFTQQGRRVLLGINRKTGDHILKLFHQIYINRHCLVMARGRTIEENTPGLKEILEKQNSHEKESRSLKTLKAHARNINSKTDQKNSKGKKSHIDVGAEVVMQVDDVPDADKMLMGRAAAWTGPSTVAKLKQAHHINVPAGKDRYPESHRHQICCQQDLSDISDNLSDISDNSDLGPGLEEHSKTLSIRKVSRPTSVRSFGRDSLLSKDADAKKSYGVCSVSSREVSESRDSKSHGIKGTDVFGRSQDMRDKFKTLVQVEHSSSPSWRENERERRKAQSDFMNFMTGPTDVRQSTSSQQGSHKKETKVFDGVKERDRLSKYARYSPETEWLLLKRDEEKALAMGKGSRSRSPQVDSRDRFKRLVEEKMRGLEDFVSGCSRQERDQDDKSSKSSRQRFSREKGSDKDRGLLKRRHRASSPSERHVRKERSASPLRRTRGITRKELVTGNEGEATGHKKASPPPFSLSGCRITIDRQKSLSPLHKKGVGKGYSSFSPIKIDDDDEEEEDRKRVKERGRRKQHEYINRQPRHIQSHRDTGIKEYKKIDPVKMDTRKETHPEVPVKEHSSFATPVSATDNDSKDSTSAEREILHEFVKQLLERANITTGTSTEVESSSFISNPSPPETENKMSSNRVCRQQEDDYLCKEHSNTDLARKQTETTKLIPPPIPPPVMPPLFPPDPESEKISQLESLAKQLADDIKRQQPLEPPLVQQPQRPPHALQQQPLAPQQVQQQQPHVLSQIQKSQQYQQQLFTPTLHPQSFTQTSQAQGYVQHTSKASDGLLPPPLLPVPMNQPPPPLIHTTMPSPHLMVAAAPPPLGIMRQPTVPLPYFSNMATSVRLHTLSNMSQSQGENKNNNFSGIQLNPDGKFF